MTMNTWSLCLIDELLSKFFARDLRTKSSDNDKDNARMSRANISNFIRAVYGSEIPRRDLLALREGEEVINL